MSVDRQASTKVSVPPNFQPHSGGISYANVKAQCEFWERETGCQIEPRLSQGHGARRLTEFHLFGSWHEKREAIPLIHKWMEDAHKKSAATMSWTKQGAFVFNEWYYRQIQEMEEERKQMFLEPLPEYQDLPYRVAVQWSDELLHQYNWTPRDAFGNKLEKLNPLRKSDEVFITLLPDSRPPWQVMIQGFDEECVRNAEAHYINAVKRELNWKLGDYPVNIVLDEAEGTQVVLECSEPWWPAGLEVVPRLVTSPIDDPGSFRISNRLLNQQVISQIEDGITSTLNFIRFENGCHDFAIRFGCLTLGDNIDRFSLDKPYPLTQFKKVTLEGGLCAAKSWLCEYESGRRLLTHLMQCNRILEPTKDTMFGFLPSSLKETRPKFRATYIFKDPNRLTHYMAVQIDWTRDEHGGLERSVRYYHVTGKAGEMNRRENMDVKLLELAESKAWHFSMTSMLLLPKRDVSPAVKQFVEAVQLRIGDSPHSTFAFHQAYPGVNIEKIIQSRTYTFGIRSTDYMVDLTSTLFPPIRSTFQKQPLRENLPVWGLSVRHTEWAKNLTQLETLGKGCEADWPEDVLKHFIPDNGEGHGEFSIHTNGTVLLLEKLMELSREIHACSRPDKQEVVSLGAGLSKIKLLDI